MKHAQDEYEQTKWKKTKLYDYKLPLNTERDRHGTKTESMMIG